jgi:hypothetical protein
MYLRKRSLQSVCLGLTFSEPVAVTATLKAHNCSENRWPEAVPSTAWLYRFSGYLTLLWREFTARRDRPSHSCIPGHMPRQTSRVHKPAMTSKKERSIHLLRRHPLNLECVPMLRPGRFAKDCCLEERRLTLEGKLGPFACMSLLCQSTSSYD